MPRPPRRPAPGHGRTRDPQTRKQYAAARAHVDAVGNFDITAYTFWGSSAPGVRETQDRSLLDYVYTNHGIFDMDGNPLAMPRLSVDPTWTLLK